MNMQTKSKLKTYIEILNQIIAPSTDTNLKVERCDPALMKAYFKKHFTAETIDNKPIELIDAPTFFSHNSPYQQRT